MELTFLMGGVLEVTSRELKFFQRGLRIFGEIENVSNVGVEALSVVETFIRNDVFL